MRTQIIAGWTALLLLQGPAVTRAANVMVPPGDGTLQAAVDAAAPGDVLVLTGEVPHYSGAVIITKSDLSIITAPGLPPVIDAGCTSGTAVTITGDNITLGNLRHGIYVEGGSDTAVSAIGASSIRMNVAVVHTCADENYGLDIQGTTKLHVAASVSSPGGSPAEAAFVQAGLRLRGVTRPVKVRASLPGNRLVIEDCGASTSRPGRSGIIVEAPNVSDGSTTLLNSNGIFVRGLRDYCFLGALQIDSLSSDNKFMHCTADSLADSGTGDCGRSNTGFTLPPCG